MLPTQPCAKQAPRGWPHLILILRRCYSYSSFTTMESGIRRYKVSQGVTAELAFRALWFQRWHLNRYMLLPPVNAQAPSIWALSKSPFLSKIWLVKFVFFKERRKNEGPLPVCFGDLHAFLGVMQNFSVFFSGVSDALFTSGRSSSARYLQPHLFCLLFCGLTGENSCVFSIYFSLPPSYDCASMILELKNGEQNAGLSPREFSVVS